MMVSKVLDYSVLAKVSELRFVRISKIHWSRESEQPQ